MGVADVIPGVSGGTIAFITGIYEELVHSINEFDSASVRLLSKFQFAACWKKINGNFLAAVFGGVATSLLLLSGMMLYLLRYYPIMTWSFFFGLILMSFPLILRKIKKWKLGSVTGFIVGIGLAYLLTISSPVQTSDNIFFVFLAGAIAICAMVLPGISGVFILLLIGKYLYIVTALNEANIFVMLVFTIGCVSGLISVSRLLTWALANYNQIVISLLSGFMVGALNKVWPWRKVLEYATNSKGDQIAVFDKSVLPWDYLSETGKDPQLFQAIFMMALGVLMVVLIEKIAVRLKTKH
jgi:putative membrane protein